MDKLKLKTNLLEGVLTISQYISLLNARIRKLEAKIIEKEK